MGEDEDNIFRCEGAFGVIQVRREGVHCFRVVCRGRQFKIAVQEASAAAGLSDEHAACLAKIDDGNRSQCHPLRNATCVHSEATVGYFIRVRKDRHANRIRLFLYAVACCSGFVRRFHVVFRGGLRCQDYLSFLDDVSRG